MKKWGEEWAMPVVLLAFLASAPVFLAPAATWSFLTASGTWSWVERLSWLVTIVGLAFALYQIRVLQRDQKRVSDELTRRPKIVVGFREPYAKAEGQSVAPQGTIRPEWDSNEPFSRETSLAITVANLGEKTARDMVSNFTLPTVVARVRVHGGGGSTSSVTKDSDGGSRVVVGIASLNPGVQHRILCSVQLHPTDAFTCGVSVSLEDALPEPTSFRVLVATQPSGPLPHMLTREEIAAKLSEG